MLIQLVQRKVPLGSAVTFELTTGHKVTGVLVELGEQHITLRNDEGEITILASMVGAWQSLGGGAGARPSTETESPTRDAGMLPTPAGELPPKADAGLSGQQQPTRAVPWTDNDANPNPLALTKVIEARAIVDAKIASAVLEWSPPEFEFPADEMAGSRRKDALSIWNTIKQRYDYARKVSELTRKHGRIQPIIADLKRLADAYPNSASLHKYLAYFYYLLDDLALARDSYMYATRTTKSRGDWRNLAALAIKTGESDLASYALTQYFAQEHIGVDEPAWYTYIRLVKATDNSAILRQFWGDVTYNLDEVDCDLLIRAVLYLLQHTNDYGLVEQLSTEWQITTQPAAFAEKAVDCLQNELQPSYLEVSRKVEGLTLPEPLQSQSPRIESCRGHIYTYKADRNFGFITGDDGGNYFFHRSAVIDPTLHDRLQHLPRGEQVPVTFSVAEGPRGPLALKISLERSIDELFDIASQYASAGEYPQAIGYIRQLLARQPQHAEAKQLHDKWREYARVAGVPAGSNPYARAKRVQLIEKDLNRAADLFLQAIKQGDRVESAIKDLATLYDQQGDTEKAITLLTTNLRKFQDQQSVQSMLIPLHIKEKHYREAIDLLRIKLSQTSDRQKRIQVRWQIATSYLSLEDYAEARRLLQEISRDDPDNIAARRNIAICLFKEKNFDAAKTVLTDVLNSSPDAEAAELLEAITQAQATGESSVVDEIIVDTTLSEFSGETSEFTRFFLARCEFQGVPPDRAQREDFRLSDVRELESVATKLGTRRPSYRAGLYLSAARILSVLDEASSDQFFRYIGRSFASSGDATVAESRPLDAAREWYAEALSVYDRDRSRSRDEQDAVNALVRYLYSTLGQTQIPQTPNIPTIDETLEEVLRLHPQQHKVFDAIGYLVFRSRYAANRILRRLFDKSSPQAMSLQYLRSQGIAETAPVKKFDDFVGLWNELRRRRSDQWRGICSEFRFIARLELTTASLSACVQRLKALEPEGLFDLDQQRVNQLRSILLSCQDLVRADAFEERERLCIQIDSRCDDLLREIRDSPTKLSVEELHPVVDTIKRRVTAYLEDLYESSIPQLEMRLPFESYTPDGNLRLEIQICVENKMGRSPAEKLQLVIPEIPEEERFFTLDEEVKLDESLRGGEQHILVVPISVTQEALASQTFSLAVYAQYQTRAQDVEQTSIHSFSIRLYPEEEFQPIANPYEAYAEGGVVNDPMMFFGREDLIDSVTKVITDARGHSKSIVVFGQKRAGKSSILYHIKRHLTSSNNLLVLDIGNIGSLIDEQSSTPFTYQILWAILQELSYAIEDRVSKDGYPPIEIVPPGNLDFYAHPSPLSLFRDTFKQFGRIAQRTELWRDIHVVLLIDEFSYIYEQIVKGNIPEVFMKNWKALLQEGFFSVVLAGQDVMPKFKQRFPNEFGTTQDERVSYLRRQDAIRLIDEPTKIGGRQGESRFRERAIDQIVDLTAGSPFYIQIICHRLVRYMNEKRASLVTEADVLKVKSDLIRGVNALSLDKFDNLISSGDTSEDAIPNSDTLAVLKAIALNSQGGSCNRNSIACETSSAVDSVLEDLVNRDVVEQEQGKYFRIRVGLFRDWLLAN